MSATRWSRAAWSRRFRLCRGNMRAGIWPIGLYGKTIPRYWSSAIGFTAKRRRSVEPTSTGPDASRRCFATPRQLIGSPEKWDQAVAHLLLILRVAGQIGGKEFLLVEQLPD